jgi:hypothetical protein
MKRMTNSQLLSQTDGNILGLLTDPRVSSTAVGAVLGNVLEKQVFANQRAIFGKAVSVAADGSVKYVDEAGVEQAKFKTNRQLMHAGLILLGVAAIEYVPDNSGVLQYAMLGLAAISAAHLVQSFVPALR